MAPHRPRIGSRRTAHITTALLTGLMLSGCGVYYGQPDVTSQDNGAPAEEAPRVAERSANTEPVDSREAVGSTRSTGATRHAGQQASEQPDRCHTSMLSGRFQGGNPGAGQRYADLIVTNTSGQPCTLYGYGGLQLVDANGAPLPTQLERIPNPGPTMIRLAPGQAASKTLHWTAVPHGGEPIDRPCQPTASAARIIPPDETDPLVVPWDFGPVCGFGALDGSAYH